jgi:hypothetical protein
MSRLKFLTIIILSLVFLTCESDDICDPALTTTPHAVIEFYDRTLTNSLKSVTNLKVFDLETQSFLVINQAATGDGRFVLNGNKMLLQLNHDPVLKKSRYQFVFNATDTNAANRNTDVLEFNYNPSYTYVSRGCGYKAIFSNLLPIIITDQSPNDGFWINATEIINPDVINENITHVKIYF